jgi:hypothetical protein
MNPWIQLKTTTLSVLNTSVLRCFGLSPTLDRISLFSTK